MFLHHYSHAQVARGLADVQAGRPVEPMLRKAVADLPRLKSPLQREVEMLRRELEILRRSGSFVVRGFEIPVGGTGY